jgi:hypothetical protein
MTISPLAGKPAPKDLLADLARLEREYYARRPDLDDPEQRSASAPAGIAARLFADHLPKPTSLRSRRLSVTIAAPTA